MSEPSGPRIFGLTVFSRLAGVVFVLVSCFFLLTVSVDSTDFEIELEAGESGVLDVPQLSRFGQVLNAVVSSEEPVWIEPVPQGHTARQVGDSASFPGSIEQVRVVAGGSAARVRFRLMTPSAQTQVAQVCSVMVGILLVCLGSFLRPVLQGIRRVVPAPASEESIPRRRVALILLAAVVLYQCVYMFSGIVWEWLTPVELPAEILQLFWVAYCWLPFVVILALTRWEGRSVLAGLRTEASIAGTLLGVVLLFGAVGANLLGWIDPGKGDGETYFMEIAYGPGSVPVLILWALTAGITEEILFRGYLMSRLRDLTGSPLVALLVSSIAFGCIHFGYGWGHALATGVAGILFGAIVLQTRNLYSAIWAHCAVDILVTMSTVARMLRGL